jgi:hypothetical protein
MHIVVTSEDFCSCCYGVASFPMVQNFDFASSLLLLEPCNVTIYNFSTLHRWYKNGKVHTSCAGPIGTLTVWRASLLAVYRGDAGRLACYEWI